MQRIKLHFNKICDEKSTEKATYSHQSNAVIEMYAPQ